MASNILIIEPDLNFSQKLTDSLNELGFTSYLRTDIADPEDLLEIRIPLQCIILNLELKSLEGLTLYSYLKNLKPFKGTSFAFLADSKNIFRLLENIPLERAILVNKEDDYDALLAEIVNNIPLPDASNATQGAMLELEGNLSDLPLDDLFLYCRKTCFTGLLFLSKEKEFGVIPYSFGTREQINYRNLSDERALDVFHAWNDAGFRLERTRFTSKEARQIAVSCRTKEGKEQESSPVNLSDLFEDIFTFLFTFLNEQLLEQNVSAIFYESLEVYNSRSSAGVEIFFNPGNEEIFSFSEAIRTDEIESLVNLVVEIFLNAKLYEPELNLRDFLDDIHELDPYLKEIHFYEFILPKNKRKQNKEGKAQPIPQST